MKRYALPALLAINGALALGLMWLWFTPQGVLRNVHWQPPEAQKTDFAAMIPALPGAAAIDTRQFIAMLDRPLFAITRRPPPPPPPPAPPAPVDNFSTARLSGVFQGAGTGGIIMQFAGKDRRVQLNQAVDGWTLKSIQGREVTFANGGQLRTLQLPRAVLTTYTGLAPAPNSARAGAAAQSPLQPVQPGGAAQENAANAAAHGSTGAAARPKATFGGSAGR